MNNSKYEYLRNENKKYEMHSKPYSTLINTYNQKLICTNYSSTISDA